MDSLLHLLMELAVSEQLSLSLKIRVLASLRSLCKRAKALSWDPKNSITTPTSTAAADADTRGSALTFRFDHQPLWDAIMRIVSRGGRDVAQASEHVLSEYLTSLVEFLHGARHFIRDQGTQ